MGRNKMYEGVRKQVAIEALSGIKVAVLARKYEVSPETIRICIREYRDQLGEDEIPSIDEQFKEMKRLQEVETKYEKAVKILGEKELEIEILRELLKKNNSTPQKNLK